MSTESNANLIGRRVCAGDGPYCLQAVTHEDAHGVYCTEHGHQRARLGFATHRIVKSLGSIVAAGRALTGESTE